MSRELFSDDTTRKANQDEPHYKGHRDRLRARFVQGGSDALSDYELLELVLFMAIPRRDVKPLAKSLITEFRDYKGVLNAPVEKLTRVNGLSDTSAIALKSVQAAAQRLLRYEAMEHPVINSWSRLIDYCTAVMAHLTHEEFRVLFLNKKLRLIADEVQARGTVDHAPAYPREIVKWALDLGAGSIILVHNHPSGDPAPSADDIQLTEAVAAAAEPMGITLHDHVIIGRGAHVSFKAKGLL